VRGALLATPADFERPLPDGYPSMEALAEGRRLLGGVRAFSQLGSSKLRKISFLAVKKLDVLIAAAGNVKAGSDGA
jgi:hypothetical protein